MYLHRSKFGVYYYRYTLPRYIRDQHPSLPSSVKRSLGTSRRSEAVYLMSRWHATVHEAITKLLVDGILDLPYTLDKESYARKPSYTEITKLEEALAAALLGHAHNSMSYGNYGSEYGVEKLYENLRCLNSVNSIN